MRDDSEKRWLTDNGDDIVDNLLFKTPQTFTGLSEAGRCRLIDSLGQISFATETVFCHCPIDGLIAAEGAANFCRKAHRRILRDACGWEVSDDVDSGMSFLSRFRRELAQIGKEAVLVLTGYDRLLSLPSEERERFVGGTVFPLCDTDGPVVYRTATLIFSEFPVWWCEYEADPAHDSVVYQRTMDWIVRDPTPEECRAIVPTLPPEIRDRFLDRTGLRMGPYQ